MFAQQKPVERRPFEHLVCAAATIKILAFIVDWTGIGFDPDFKIKSFLGFLELQMFVLFNLKQRSKLFFI